MYRPCPHLCWDELIHGLHTRPSHLAVVPDLINAFVPECAIPIDTLNNLVEYLPRKPEAFIQ